MRAPGFFKDAYDKLWRLVTEEHVKPPSRFLPYSFTTHSGDLIYDLQEQDFTRELLNSINQFSARLHRLVLWEHVISNYEEGDALELRFEFTRLMLYYCLHQPYEFRSRLIFASTHLCYVRGLAARPLSRKEIKSDRDINYKTLEQVVERWEAGKYLLESVRTLNAAKFRDRTANYRNRAQHGVPPGIDFGHTNVVQRSVAAAGNVSYTFGEAPPLSTSEIVPLLIAESERMITAFHAYRLLVDEHVANMTTKT